MGADEQALESAVSSLQIDPDFVLPLEHRPICKPEIGLEDDIPVIDLSPLAAYTSWNTEDDGRELEHENNAALRNVLAKVAAACEEWGFFQVINHGVPEQLLAALKREAKLFFDQPLEEKRKVRRSFENNLGYYDAERTKNVRDWKEVFDFAVRGSLELPDLPLESEEETAGTTVFRNRWPEGSENFRAACEKWSEAVERLAFKLLALIALSLGLRADTFHSFYRDHSAYMRLNHYPVCPAPELALGVSRHKDSGALTVLVQDDAGGLQVKRKDGEWIDVKPRSDAFVINVGDCFQVWSNDRYKSVEHRAIVHTNKERFSFPLFFNPNHKTDIMPIAELVGGDQSPRYRAFNYGRYRKSRSNTNFKIVGGHAPNIQIADLAIPAT